VTATATSTPTDTPTATATTPPAGSIAGLVWADTNADGRPDGGEAGLPNVRLSLFGEAAQSGLAEPAMAWTDAAGQFAFAQVSPGAYRLTAELLAGYFATTPAEIDITVTAGMTAPALFGQRPYSYLWLPLVIRR